jgi:hypothetical protein
MINRCALPALLAVALFALCTHAQFIPWTRNSTATGQIILNQCSDANGPEGSVNCWKQTSGAPDVVIDQYIVYSDDSQFPCLSGMSESDFQITSSKEITGNEGSCTAHCKGFGCSDGEVALCAGVGINCPQPAGTFITHGNANGCKKGIGTYTITLTCPTLFELVTIIKY